MFNSSIILLPVLTDESEEIFNGLFRSSDTPKRSGPEGSDCEYKKLRVCFLSEDLPQIYQFWKKFAAVVDAYDAKDFFHVVFYGIFTDKETFGNIPV